MKDTIFLELRLRKRRGRRRVGVRTLADGLRVLFGVKSAARGMKVRVLVRVRPVLPHETRRGEASTHLSIDEVKGTIGTLTKQGKVTSYQVDEVCSDQLTQEEVYAAGELDKLVGAVMRGYHATVFAYGQTGSGKTFTMEGYEYRPAEKGKPPMVDVDGTAEERLGVIPRTVQALFAEVARRNAEGGETSRRVVCSFVQVHR